MVVREPQAAGDYDDWTTAAVKSVLIEIGQILGSFEGKFAIIGGAVPWLLLGEAEMPHVGTADVDLGLDPGCPGRRRIRPARRSPPGTRLPSAGQSAPLPTRAHCPRRRRRARHRRRGRFPDAARRRVHEEHTTAYQPVCRPACGRRGPGAQVLSNGGHRRATCPTVIATASASR